MDIKVLTRITQLRQTMVKQESNQRTGCSVEKNRLLKDSVSIARYPKALEKYNSLVSQDVEQLEKRVQEIKQELKDGTYQIDVDAIVNALINH